MCFHRLEHLLWCSSRQGVPRTKILCWRFRLRFELEWESNLYSECWRFAYKPCLCLCFFNFWGGGLNELLVKRQLMTAVGQIGRSSRSRSNDWWLNDNFLIKAWELNKFIKFTMARTTRDLRYVRLFGHKDLHMNAQKSFINLSSCSRSSSSLLFCFGFVFYLLCRPIKVRFIRNGW